MHRDPGQDPSDARQPANPADSALHFLDAKITAPGKVDWIMWVILVPFAIIAMNQGWPVPVVVGVLAGVSLAAFGITIARSPKAFVVVMLALGGMVAISAGNFF